MIYAFSGTHGTGKTTAALEFASSLKKKYPTKRIGFLSEVARTCPYPINQFINDKSQMWIFSTQISRELSMLSYNDIVVSDRSAIDAIAYTLIGNMHSLAAGMEELIKRHLGYYKEIRIKLIENNPYNYEDGTRNCNDEIFRKGIQNHIISITSRLCRSSANPPEIFYA
jgi:hypothetical protein